MGIGNFENRNADTKSWLDRFMRVLTAMGVCDEVDVQSYKANSVTIAFAQKGLSSGVKFR